MVQAVISISALKHNIRLIKSTSSSSSNIIWVLKANAYGHGLSSVAKLLNSGDIIAVARVSEAIELRKNSIKNPILLLEGVFDRRELLVASELYLDCVVHSEYQLKLFSENIIPNPIKVWLKIDIGMHRLGVSVDKVNKYLEILSKQIKVREEFGFLGHLSTADDMGSNLFDVQVHNFKCTLSSVREKYKLTASLVNSAAFFRDKELHFDYSRIGIALYGISPYIGSKASQLGLKPVMTLRASLIATRLLNKGEYVGYGHNWCTEKKTVVGVVDIGYGDGIPRDFANGVQVKINSRMVDVVGVVCMDMLLINLGADSSDCIGDEVLIWGEGLGVEHLALMQKTIPYELVCNLSSRVERLYV